MTGMAFDRRFRTRRFVVAIHLGRRYQWGLEHRGSRYILATPLGMVWILRRRPLDTLSGAH